MLRSRLHCLNPNLLRWRLRHPLMDWDHAVSHGRFRVELGRELNLKSPVLFCDKLHWLKLYDRRKIHGVFADKLAARKLVADAGFPETLNDIYATWNTPQEMVFSSLPGSFVLKGNFGSSMNWIKRPNDELNEAAIRKTAMRWFRRDHSLVHGEAQYRHIQRKLFAERWLGDGSLPPPDYKIHCFGGEPRFIRYFAHHQSSADRSIWSFDMDWQPMQMDKPEFLSETGACPPRPKTLPDMIRLARALSSGEPFLRVDVFEIQGQLKFCELTLHPDGGNMNYFTDYWERRLGEWTCLPSKDPA